MLTHGGSVSTGAATVRKRVSAGSCANEMTGKAYSLHLPGAQNYTD
jgi:hypothetical protein